MIIDQLPTLASVQATDEIPVERGTTTYKTTLQKLKDLITSLLTKADIGLGNVDNVRQYSADNPPPYPVTSVNGQTGDVEIGEKLLWTNANPNTNFAPQTILLDLSGYSRVKIQFTPFGNTNQVDFSECIVGSASCLFYMQFSTDNTSSAATFLNGVARNYSVTATGVTFENGRMVYSGAAYVDWQNRSVPWKIFGIK